MVIALRLSKVGYFHGDPEAVLSARVDIVLAAMEYEKFQFELEDATYELNKD